MGSERPENCPVDSFQWRTGGSPGKGATTFEIADSGETSSPFCTENTGADPTPVYKTISNCEL